MKTRLLMALGGSPSPYCVLLSMQIQLVGVRGRDLVHLALLPILPFTAYSCSLSHAWAAASGYALELYSASSHGMADASKETSIPSLPICRTARQARSRGPLAARVQHTRHERPPRRLRTVNPRRRHSPLLGLERI
jgi:hypothetical protein